MTLDILLRRFSDEVPDGVPQWVGGGRALLEVEGSGAVCGTGREAVAHSWETAVDFSVLGRMWKRIKYVVRSVRV